MGSSPSTPANQNRPSTTPNVGKNNSLASNGDVNSASPRAPRSAAHTGKRKEDERKTSKLPPPVPPKTKKAQIFDVKQYKHVDDYVLSAPPSLIMGSFKELAMYLTANEDWTEMENLRAIYRWVASVDVFSIQSEVEPPMHSPLEYFMKIQNSNGNHAHLFCGLCQMVGLKCVIISGMNKSAAYEVGGKADRKAMGAQWNAVYVDGDWRFVDVFWSSACVVGKKSNEWTLIDTEGNVTQEDGDEDDSSEGETQHRINEFYFLPDPEHLIWTHFPDETPWQLLEKPMNVKDFENHVYKRERFYYLNMSLIDASYRDCLINTSNGQVQLAFGLPFRESEHYRFKYMLYQSKTVVGQSDISLDRFVLFEHTADNLRFALRFPLVGKFKMDIFGLDMRESDHFDLCCTYVITCDESQKNCAPLPDCPEIGWGPGAEAKNAGLVAKTHDSAIINSKDGQMVIKLGSHKDVQLHQLLKNTNVDEATLSKYAFVREENGEFVVEVRLPQGGEYALKLYCSDDQEDGDAENVLNYLLQCDDPNVTNKPFPNLTDGRLGRKPWADVLGVKAVSHTDGKIRAKDGKVKLNFIAKNNLDLLCEVHSHDQEALKHMDLAVREVNGKWTLDCDLPIEGEYGVNIFAREKNGGPRIYNVQTYFVTSDGHTIADGEKGDDSKSTSSDVESPIHVITETVQTSDRDVLIPIPAGYEEVVASFQRRHANDHPDDDSLKISKVEGMKFFKAKLDEYGEYMFDVYSKDGRLVSNVAKYQINRKPASELYEDNTKMLMDNLGILDESQSNDAATDEEKARKAARARIQKGMNLKDLDTLEKGLLAYEGTDPPDIDKDPFIKKARKLCELLKAKEALNVASQKRDCKMLEEAIEQAKAANYDNLLDLQIAMASRLRDQLQRIEKLRHAVLSMDQKTVSELRTYQNPPEGVHQSLQATFILLGHTKKEVAQWKTVQALLGKTGRESVMRKISQFDPNNCFLQTAVNAKKASQDFSLEMIRDVSAGAATFYVWSKGMIDVVENSGGAQEKDPMTKPAKSVSKKKSNENTTSRENSKSSLKKSGTKKKR